MYRILLLLLLIFSINPAFSQSGKEVELTYLHKVPFPHLFKAGDRERLVQQCTLIIDSTIQGTVHFEKAQIGDIKNCKMTMRITSDTIRSYHVETSGRHETKQLLKQALAIYGNASHTSITDDTVRLEWKEPGKNGHFIISVLTIDKQGKHGDLISSIK